MKLTSILALSTSLALGLSAAETAFKLTNEKDKASYCVGMDLGKGLKAQALDINPEALAAGLCDVLASRKTLITEEQAQAILAAFKKELMGRREVQRKEAAEKNGKEGETFLGANRKKDGIKVTASGLQYKIVTVGKGRVPKAADAVKAHYRGTLVDGTEFDSSYKRNEPVVFPVSGVIPGWTEALQIMPVGSKWQLFIPANLAYGEGGAGDVIGPNATLIFEVELLGIEEAAK
jgi:FKBP-type peptidyl-prolyl cis-trans isomerase FklB